jgi:hypothetical protein
VGKVEDNYQRSNRISLLGATNQQVFDYFIVQNLGQGLVPGGKVVAAQKALAQPRMKAVLLYRSAARQIKFTRAPA